MSNSRSLHIASSACLFALISTAMAAPDAEPVGSGSFFTSLPDGQSGPSDTAGLAVQPRITDDFIGPVPTNTWWSSLLWQRYPGNAFGEAMHPHPLSLQAQASGLRLGHVSTPSPTGAGYGYHFTDTTHALTIGLQGLQASEVQVASAGDWTVTAAWEDVSHSMRATFGRGLPTVLVEIETGVPSVSINPGSGGAASIDIQGSRVILDCAGSTWGLFAPEGATWTLEGDTFLAVGASKIAVAVLPDDNESTIQRFTERALVAVRDTTVSWEWNPGSRTVEATYEFTTDSNLDPLVCLYGHQVAHTNQDGNEPWGLYESPRGPMTLMGTSGFTLSIPCPPLLPLLPDTGSIDPNQLQVLLDDAVDDENFPSDTYWFGKALGRHGQLALIADQLGDIAARDQLLDAMKIRLETWLSVSSSTGPSAADRLQAEAADDSDGIIIEAVDGADGEAVTGFGNGDWIRLNSIEFTDELPLRALLRFASGTSGSAMVSLRLDALDGPVIAEAALGGTGGWTAWEDLAMGIAVSDPSILEGLHDVYVTCDTPYAGDIFSLDWFTFDYGDSGPSEQYFAHDSTWSTLIGYPASYGSDTELNDHHFHYGYFIMGAAIVARFDPGWAQADAWGGMVELLIKDAANWDRSDDRFCFLRHMEPYVGYSYASGHAGFAAGNNQESSSEAIHFANACVLWGAHTNNDDILELGLFLLALESTAVEQYWFDVDESVFPEVMPHPLAGIVWDSGADYATWWTANPEEIHGINVLPVTAGSLYLGQRPDAVTRSWNHLLEQNGGEPTVWQDILWSYLSLADADAALEMMHSNQDYGSEGGDSKARTYHWLAAMTGLGQVHSSVTGDAPLSAVFIDGEVTTYVAHNPGTDRLDVTFTDGQTFCVPAGETYWSHTNQDGDCPPVADLDGNGSVDVLDLLILLDSWGPCRTGGCPADLDGDDQVTVSDLLILLGEWTP